jgi:hypothetical protein
MIAQSPSELRTGLKLTFTFAMPNYAGKRAKSEARGSISSRLPRPAACPFVVQTRGRYISEHPRSFPQSVTKFGKNPPTMMKSTVGFLIEVSQLLVYCSSIDTGRTTVPLSPQLLTARTFQTFSNID